MRFELTTPGLQDQCSNPWAKEPREMGDDITDDPAAYLAKDFFFFFFIRKDIFGKTLKLTVPSQVKS